MPSPSSRQHHDVVCVKISDRKDRAVDEQPMAKVMTCSRGVEAAAEFLLGVLLLLGAVVCRSSSGIFSLSVDFIDMIK